MHTLNQSLPFLLADDSGAAGAAAFLLFFFGFFFLVFGLIIAGLWKVFVKAGKPGWAVLIPIYNIIVMLEIAQLPIWMIVLFFIPFINFLTGIYVHYTVATKFGKGPLFVVGMIFLPFIFFPILGFDDSVYQG